MEEKSFYIFIMVGWEGHLWYWRDQHLLLSWFECIFRCWWGLGNKTGANMWQFMTDKPVLSCFVTYCTNAFWDDLTFLRFTPFGYQLGALNLILIQYKNHEFQASTFSRIWAFVFLLVLDQWFCQELKGSFNGFNTCSWMFANYWNSQTSGSSSQARLTLEQTILLRDIPRRSQIELIKIFGCPLVAARDGIFFKYTKKNVWNKPDSDDDENGKWWWPKLFWVQQHLVCWM